MGIDYDAWLVQPYEDMCANEATYSFNCAEINDLYEDEEQQEDGLPYCDFDGELDCYAEKSSGKSWWEVEYTAKCPKCGRSLVATESDYRDDHDW